MNRSIGKCKMTPPALRITVQSGDSPHHNRKGGISEHWKLLPWPRKILKTSTSAVVFRTVSLPKAPAWKKTQSSRDSGMDSNLRSWISKGKSSSNMSRQNMPGVRSPPPAICSSTVSGFQAGTKAMDMEQSYLKSVSLMPGAWMGSSLWRQKRPCPLRPIKVFSSKKDSRSATQHPPILNCWSRNSGMPLHRNSGIRLKKGLSEIKRALPLSIRICVHLRITGWTEWSSLAAAWVFKVKKSS